MDKTSLGHLYVSEAASLAEQVWSTRGHWIFRLEQAAQSQKRRALCSPCKEVSAHKTFNISRIDSWIRLSSSATVLIEILIAWRAFVFSLSGRESLQSALAFDQEQVAKCSDMQRTLANPYLVTLG